MDSNKIFKNGSTTFYFSSIAFSKRVRHDITTLYAFVRVADNYVDQIPQDIESFNQLEKKVLSDNESGDEIIDGYKRLAKKYHFKEEWTRAFLDSMRSDIGHQKVKDKESMDKYIYGSAVVIGYMLCAIHNLDESTYEKAGKLGYAFQLINFIRDLNEDYGLGRRYFPNSTISQYGIDDLSPDEILKNENAFKKFVKEQIKEFKEIQLEGLIGSRHLPFRSRIAVRTAADLFTYTAKVIEENPLIVMEKQVKPSKRRVFGTLILNTLCEILNINKPLYMKYDNISDLKCAVKMPL